MDAQPASGLPAIFSMAEAEVAEMSAEIKTLGKELKSIKKRGSRMAIFADRTGKDGKIKPRSQVELESSPEEEMLYEHRRLYEQTQKALTALLEKLEPLTPSEDDVRLYHHSIRMLQSMLSESKDHLTAMRQLQVDVRNRESALEDRVIDIVQERSRAVARLMEHNDKMDLARKAGDALPDTALKARLAAKYGVPVDQVERMIAAKQADAEVQP
jgi:hypothetical protein